MKTCPTWNKNIYTERAKIINLRNQQQLQGFFFFLLYCFVPLFRFITRKSFFSIFSLARHPPKKESKQEILFSLKGRLNLL